MFLKMLKVSDTMAVLQLLINGYLGYESLISNVGSRICYSL